MDLPFSQACENNKSFILEVLLSAFRDRKQVLEIGSGTGQHSVFFAPNLAHLTWQCADLSCNLPGIRQWHTAAPSPNLLEPIEFDMEQPNWPDNFDAVFSANTAHIMPWRLSQKMVTEVAQKLPRKGVFVLYGPFNYEGKFTSESNARFDAFLKEQVPHQGLRDFEAIHTLALEYGLELLQDNAMPANNRCLVWQKI